MVTNWKLAFICKKDSWHPRRYMCTLKGQRKRTSPPSLKPRSLSLQNEWCSLTPAHRSSHHPSTAAAEMEVTMTSTGQQAPPTPLPGLIGSKWKLISSRKSLFRYCLDLACAAILQISFYVFTDFYVSQNSTWCKNTLERMYRLLVGFKELRQGSIMQRKNTPWKWWRWGVTL